MTTPWKRIDVSLNGAAKRAAATPPLTQGRDGPSASAAEWEQFHTPAAPRLRYADLVVPPGVRAQLEDTLALVNCHELIFQAWGMAEKDPYGGGLSLNFYGPPGTGKSIAAEAVADLLGRPLIRVRYADLISKYVGDTNKAIAGAFRASERAGAVLIFEEADTLLGCRFRQPASGSDKSVNDAVTEMLTALDRHRGVVIFTSNLFGNYDEAFLRRIMAHVRFDPPDFDCRCRLWNNLLPPQMPLVAEVSAERLAEASEGLSGAEALKIRRLAAAKAAARSGLSGPVTWTDFAEAIARERAAKQEHRGLRVVSETTVKPEDLPPEAKAKFDAAGK